MANNAPIPLFSNNLHKALDERERFFASLSPEDREKAYKFQADIDLALAKAGPSSHNRMVILQELMQQKLLELRSSVDKLSESLRLLSSRIE